MKYYLDPELNYVLSFNKTKNETEYIFSLTSITFIEININQNSIGPSDINRYIASLEQMERYFFSKLILLMIKTLYNENDQRNTNE